MVRQVDSRSKEGIASDRAGNSRMGGGTSGMMSQKGVAIDERRSSFGKSVDVGCIVWEVYRSKHGCKLGRILL